MAMFGFAVISTEFQGAGHASPFSASSKLGTAASPAARATDSWRPAYSPVAGLLLDDHFFRETAAQVSVRMLARF